MIGTVNRILCARPGGVGGVEDRDVPLPLQPVEGVPEGRVCHRRSQGHRLLVLGPKEIVAPENVDEVTEKDWR